MMMKWCLQSRFMNDEWKFSVGASTKDIPRYECLQSNIFPGTVLAVCAFSVLLMSSDVYCYNINKGPSSCFYSVESVLRASWYARLLSSPSHTRFSWCKMSSSITGEVRIVVVRRMRQRQRLKKIDHQTSKSSTLQVIILKEKMLNHESIAKAKKYTRLESSTKRITRELTGLGSFFKSPLTHGNLSLCFMLEKNWLNTWSIN